jgi:hypothetical protein
MTTANRDCSVLVECNHLIQILPYLLRSEKTAQLIIHGSLPHWIENGYTQLRSMPSEPVPPNEEKATGKNACAEAAPEKFSPCSA